MSLYEPDRSMDECYESLNALKLEALEAAKVISVEGDEALAAFLSSLYIANQNQTLILWHKLVELEKKIDKLSNGKNIHPRWK